MMTLKRLREIVAAMPTTMDDKPVLVWLPGERVQLSDSGFIFDEDASLMLEGHVEIDDSRFSDSYHRRGLK